MEPVKFGVISTAKIGWEKVIPAMQKGKHCDIAAIASRDLARGQEWAKKLGIPKVYGSYEELLADPEIEAVYNPLPNHLHVPLSIQAAEAGKHVLCEKPVALTAEEAKTLVAARDRTGVMIAEAFMVRHHPQWLKARELVREGAIGDLRAVQVAFSYMNTDPENVRNMADIGGGGIYDIGCYAIVSPRFLFGTEPIRAVSIVERDPNFKTDRLTSALLEFPTGHAQFVISTQLVPYQRVQVFGTTGRIEIEIPFNAPLDRSCRVLFDRGGDLSGADVEVVEFDVCNQFTIQAEAFAAALLEGRPQPVPLEDAVANMACIDAVVASSRSGRWEKPGG
jgi:predicted dehydrogenase